MASAATCVSSVTRFVWAGDQLLWELRAPGAEGGDLEATTGPGERYGRVSYTQGGGIDRPLAMHKEGWQSIIPHENWRGQFAAGTCIADGASPCGAVSWPGWQTNAYHAMTAAPASEGWHGSLVDGMRDATGQMYMRNRYYDPGTGQFTQPDPIGIAGGLNVYGFADGDPVTYSDPYGLCPQCVACAAGAITDVAIGYGVSRAVGAQYRGRDVITGLVAGCAGGMLGQLAAARHLRHLRHARHIDEGAEAARIAGVASRATNPFLKVESAAREVGELGLGQGQAMEVLKQSITRMGLEYGDDVTIDGVRYLTAQVRSGNGTIRAVSIAADGKVSNATLREVRNRVYEVVR